MATTPVRDTSLKPSERFHELDERVDFFGAADDFENEGFIRAVEHAGPEDVGDSQGFDPAVTPPAHLDERELALDAGAVEGQVPDLVNRHQAGQLGLDLLDDHRRTGGDDIDAR